MLWFSHFSLRCSERWFFMPELSFLCTQNTHGAAETDCGPTPPFRLCRCGVQAQKVVSQEVPCEVPPRWDPMLYRDNDLTAI